jgi:hypothetical protein
MTFCCSAQPDLPLPFRDRPTPTCPKRTQESEPRTQNPEQKEATREATIRDTKASPEPEPPIIANLEPEICISYLQEHLIHLLHLLHLFTSNSSLPTDLSSAYRNTTYSLFISQHVRRRARPRMEAFEGQTAVYHGSILFSGIE